MSNGIGAWLQMANFTAQNMDLYLRQLRVYADDITPVLNHAVYEGAKVIADAVTDEIRNIYEVAENEHGSENNILYGITAAQKEGLLEGFGISHLKIEDNDLRFVKLGFVGYNSTKTKKYPNGQPNALIARSLISGTSFRAKNNFMNKALKNAQAAAQSAIVNTVQDSIENLKK